MKRLGAPGAPRATPPQHEGTHEASHAAPYSQYQHMQHIPTQHIPTQHMQQGQHMQQQQMQQPTQVSMHSLTQTSQPHIGGGGMMSVGGSVSSQGSSNVQTQFVRAPVRPPQSSTPVGALGSLGTPQVINYSKGGAAYSTPVSAKPPIRHKPLGSQSPGGPVQVSVGGPTNNHGGLGPSLGPSLGPALGPGVMGGPPLSAAGAAQFQRLKVEDALSYLDQVKYKFNNQPQVYNDFLDIMKEFKSQSIDTPGVIARVSNLFKGHPELIVGFNTFLPPGYKIEVQANGQGVAYQVSVSMPSPTSCGTNTTHSLHHPPTTLSNVGVGVGGAASGGPPAVSVSVSGVSQQLVHILPVPGPTPQQVSNVAVGGGSVSAGGAVQNLSGSVAANTLHHISQAHQQIEAAAAAAAQHHGPGVPHVLHAAVAQQTAPSTGQPVEFNHAIEYVNKIKSRFSRQPDKYKRFLEILHAYQRGQREVKEASVKQQTEQEVYAQVAKLFENQEDLLAEFGQFLPDATGAAKQALLHARPLQGLVHNQGLQVVPQIAPMQRNLDNLHAASLEQLQQHGGPVEPQAGVGAPSAAVGGGAGGGSGYRERPPSPTVMREREHSQLSSVKHGSSAVNMSAGQHHLKRSPSFSSSNNQIGSIVGPPAKKLRPTLGTGVAGAVAASPYVPAVGPRDVSYAEAAKYGTLADFGFFDRVRKALRSQEVYDNFLRCLLLFTNEVISKSELLCVTAPFLSRHADLQRWLHEFLGPPASPPPHTAAAQHHPHHPAAASSPPSWSAHEAPGLGYGSSSYSTGNPQASADIPPREASLLEGRTRERYESLGAAGAQLRLERPQGDIAMDVDLNTCKRLGTSYCALPRTNDARHRCSGRTALCREVLNDKWVSFPTWSEDSTFVTSRKTQYEEYIYRCEDERFELDVVIESNASTIRALEGVQKRLSRLGAEEAARYRLDECLGGTSPTIHQRALRRIYGDKATDIIAGLKKNPVVAVPVVLRRLKAKEEEWREAQKGFNKTWREQNEKFYLKSLDHQGINFKQNDLKALRSKSLYNDIESVYEERRAAVRSGALVGAAAVGPHLTVGYGLSGDKGEGAKVLKDAAELLIHHARRQTAIQKTEKRRIKQLLRNFVPDLFNHPRQPPSDDENDDDKDDVCGAAGSSSPGSANTDQSKRDKREGSSGDSDTNLSEKESRSLRNKENLISNKNNNSAIDTGAVKVEAVKNGGVPDKCETKRETETEDASARRDSADADTEMTSDNDQKDNLSTGEAAVSVGSASVGPGVFVCTSPWYLFLRLHGVLCARLAAARRAARALAQEEERDARTRRPSTAVALRLKPGNAVPVTQYYSAVLELVRGALDGNLDASAYEDGLREMLGIRAYPAYTLDKIVSYAVRQLQHCVSERRSVRCAEAAAGERARALCAAASGRRAREAQHSSAYRRRAERALRDEHAAFLVHVHGGDECRVEFELLEGAEAAPGSPDNAQPDMQGEGGGARLAAWSRYTEHLAHPTHRAHSQHGDAQWSGGRRMFLTRTLRHLGGSGAVSSARAALRACHAAVTPDTPATPPVAAVAAVAACHARRKPLHRDDAACCLRATGYRMRYVQRSTFLFSRRAQINTKKGAARARARMLSQFRRWERAWAERHVAAGSRDRPLRHCPGFTFSVGSSEAADR